MSRAAERDDLAAQIAGHLERLRGDGVWGLSIPPAPPATAPEAGGEELPAAVASADAGAATAPAREEEQVTAANPGSAADALAPVEAEALGCVACRLHEKRTKVVFGVGDPDARLMFIGEGPGRDEDLQGEPFVGRAGQLLNRIIEAMGYAREEVYIANAVKCRPPNNRDPKPDEIETCRHFLTRQVEIIAPEIIVLLGRSAVSAVLDLQAPLSRLRGRFRDWNGIQVMCTYHPAYLLRNPGAKGMVWEDMKMVRDALAESAEAAD